MSHIYSKTFSGGKAPPKANSRGKSLSKALVTGNRVPKTRPFSVPLIASQARTEKVFAEPSIEASEEFQRCDYVHVAMASVQEPDKSWRKAQVHQHRRRINHVVLYFGRNEYEGMGSEPVIMHIIPQNLQQQRPSESIYTGRASLFDNDGDAIVTRDWHWVGTPLVFNASQFMHVANVETQEADSTWTQVQVYQSRVHPEDAVLRHSRWEWEGLDRPFSLATDGRGALLESGAPVKSREWEWVCQPAKPSRKITTGMQVQARGISNKSSHLVWCDAVVTKVHGGNRYTVRYTDNAVGKRLLRKHIKLLPASSAKNATAKRRKIAPKKQSSKALPTKKRKRIEITGTSSAPKLPAAAQPDRPEHTALVTSAPASNRWLIAETTSDCLHFADDNHSIHKEGHKFSHNVFAEKGYRQGIHYWQASCHA